MSDKQSIGDPIPYDILMDLHKNYRLHKHKILSDDIKTKNETRSIHFEMDKALRDFLTGALSDSNVKGIRIYLCAYDEIQLTHPTHGKIPRDIKHVSQMTAGLVTTTKKGNKFIDYYTSLSNLLVPPINHGTLCPPDDICP